MKRPPVVLITGSSRGVGRACAIEFARLGCLVVINGAHNKEALENTKAQILALGGQCAAIFSDVSTLNGAHDFISNAKKTFGEIDILINNAGISHIGLLTDMTSDDWNKILHTNLSSVFYCCQEVIPSMIQKKSGRILNISSVWGICGASCEVAYSATKGGINAFTMALAKELAPSSISVNAVALGAVDTEMNAFLSTEERNALIDEIPAGRLAKPQEAAKFIYEIAMQTNSYMTGQVIRFDGGWL